MSIYVIHSWKEEEDMGTLINSYPSDEVIESWSNVKGLKCAMFWMIVPDEKADHIMSFTYEPKIDRVWSGEITQTIRRKGKTEKKVGDKILFHTWTGRPYRSKWGKRLLVEIEELITIQIFNKGFRVWDEVDDIWVWYSWIGSFAQHLAELDGIDPPTGQELARLLFELNKSKEGEEYQIIRWKVL